MRYYRGVLGYFYDHDRALRITPAKPRRTSANSRRTGARNWKRAARALDRYVCGECRDEGGGSRLRDFIHHLAITAWDNALTAVVASGSGSSLRYTARLPKIDRSSPDEPDPSREE